MARNLLRRSALADAAVQVLADQGSRGLSHRAIDSTAGVPAGTASNYFASRDDIISAILMRIGERLAPDLAAQQALAERTPDGALFADYIRDILRRMLADRAAAVALFELRLEATRRPHVADVLSEWRRSGLQADIEFNASRNLPGGAAEIVLFHYALDGLILDQLTTPLVDETDTDAIIETLTVRILSAEIAGSSTADRRH